jgi:hypothetical protein
MKAPNTPTALETLLTGLFDYAGMFPPAALPLDSALRESAELTAVLRRPWLLGADLVVTDEVVRRLLSMNLKLFGFVRPIRIVLLATEKPESVDELLSAVLSSTSHDSVPLSVATIERKLPLEDSASSADHFDRLAARHQVPLFLEPDLSDANWKTTLASTIALLCRCNSAAGLKCRLTGPSGIDSGRLAQAITAVCEKKLPFKVTGGLHHPFADPNREDSRGGFINVAAAVMLRRSFGAQMTEETILRLLETSDPKALVFESSLHYGELVVEPEQLAAIKGSSPFSIGSCSLKEPDEDLHQLLDCH